MEHVIANASACTFTFEQFLTEQLGICLDATERKAKNEVCRFFLRGTCRRGNLCPMNHSKSDKGVVCKHWMRGLCKKGDLCEFLHEYNLKKMPECWFFSQYGECSNAECIYLHIDPSQKIKECMQYARGFCRNGPNCRNKHVRKLICPLYMIGFCPEGPQCTYTHPKIEPVQDHHQSSRW